MINMQLTDDSGQMLDAEYSVVADGDDLAVILESKSGRAGNRAARNKDYLRAFEVILTRLKERQAVITAALVDSRNTTHLPEGTRSLLKGPLQLADVTDIDALRRRLTNAQKTIGQAPEARVPGNSTKRVRLRLAVPGYTTADADRLAADLAATPMPTATRGPDRPRLDARWTGAPTALTRPRAPEAGAANGEERSRGSGYLKDQALKVALEQYAVHTVMAHYRDVEGYDVADVGRWESYDIRATRGGEELHIEVKGSSGTAEKVELTFNEAQHARATDTHLVVVDRIEWHKRPDGGIEAGAGRIRRWTAWTPAEEHLTVTRYSYRPPVHSDELPSAHDATT